MKRKIAAGTTDLNLTVIVYDNTSTSGAGLSGLTHTTSGLILEWRRAGDSSWTQLGVGTGLAAGTLGSYVSGGIVASGSRAGRYQIGIPNAALTSGARFVEVCLRGAANMHPVDIEIELDAVNYQDATRFGLSAIPNVAQGNSGALATGNASGQVTLAGVTHTGAVIPTVTNVTNRVTANTDQWGGVAVTGMPMPTYTQPTGFLAATFPATVASPTNITSASGIVLAATTHTGALIPWNPAWDAEVQSEVQDAIEANHLDHLLAVTYDPASKPGVADALLNELVQDNGSGVSQFTSVALALASGGGGGTDWTADERTAIRSILGIPTSGTTPTDPASGILDTIRDLVIVVDNVADAIEADTQNIQGRLPAALVAGRMASNAEVVGDKAGYSLSTVGVNTIADAVLEESVDDHDGVAHSLAKYISIIKKGNTVVDGTVTSAATPTATSFSSNVNYPTGAFKHAVMLFLDGNLSEQNSPILTYTNANGVITVEEAFTQAPQVGDNFIIIPTTHVHAVAAISSAVWSDASADDAIRDAMGLATNNLDSQLASALVLQKLAASGATGSVQVTDNGNGTATLVFKDTNGSTTLATVTYNYTSGARTRVS